MKKFMAIMVTVLLISILVLAVPVSAASYTFDSSSPPSLATSPIMYNPATGYFYLWWGGLNQWIPYGTSLDIQLRLRGDWVFPVTVTSTVGYTFPTAGYETLPSQLVSFNPTVISAQDSAWNHSYVSTLIPNLPEYSGKHYKVTLQYTAKCTTGSQVNISQSQRITLYIVTP